MKNGKWRMENGEWRMENGEWRMEKVGSKGKPYSLLLFSFYKNNQYAKIGYFTITSLT